MENKKKLLGLTLSGLRTVTDQFGLPSFSAKQIADWLYKKRIYSIQEMTNLSAAARSKLDAEYEVGRYSPVDQMNSVDGTIKYLFSVHQNSFIESVYIPSEDRATLCVSSQIGCKMNCLFCMTGKQGFTADLTSHEIINQIQSIPESEKLTNIVFMGMGEPLDNTEELFKALEILTSPWGYGWSPRRITVSTVGVPKGLKQFLEQSDCHLAVSLHSPFPDERLNLMPIQKAFPAKDVIELIREYDFYHQRRVSFEYIVFKDLNDSLEHAYALAELLKGIPCRVNLIRFHAIPGVSLQSSDLAVMEKFRETLNSKGLICTIRTSRGEDILAACGMLSTSKKSQNNS